MFNAESYPMIRTKIEIYIHQIYHQYPHLHLSLHSALQPHGNKLDESLSEVDEIKYSLFANFECGVSSISLLIDFIPISIDMLLGINIPLFVSSKNDFFFQIIIDLFVSISLYFSFVSIVLRYDLLNEYQLNLHHTTSTCSFGKQSNQCAFFIEIPFKSKYFLISILIIQIMTLFDNVNENE